MLIFVFAIPFQTRFVVASWTPRFNEWTSAFIWGTDILFIILLAVFVVQKHEPLKKLDFFEYLVLALIVLAGLSIIRSQEISVAVYRWIKLAEYACVFFYFKRRIVHVVSHHALAVVWIGSSVFQSLVGLLQYYLQHSIGLKILGESVLRVNGSGVAVVVANSQLYLRAYGTTPHPNVLAVVLMIGLWCTLWIYLDSDRYWSRHIIAAYAVILTAFLLTFSRVAIGVWTLSSLTMLIVLIRRGSWRRIMPIVLTTIIVIGLCATAWWPQFSSRLNVSSQDEGIVQRIFYTEVAGKVAREHMLLGIGIGQFVPHFMDTLKNYPSSIYQPVHNLYLLVLDELGLAGLIIFLVFLALILLRLWRSNTYLFICFIALLVLGLFDHFFWTLQQGGLVFWAFLGMALVEHPETRIGAFVEHVDDKVSVMANAKPPSARSSRLEPDIEYLETA